MTSFFDLRRIKLTRQLLEDDYFLKNLHTTLQKATLAAIASDDMNAGTINLSITDLDVLASGNDEQKKEAMDNILGEWDQLLKIINQSPTPVTSPPLPKTFPAAEPALNSKRIDDEGFTHPNKVCKLDLRPNDNVNIKLNNKFENLSENLDNIIEMEKTSSEAPNASVHVLCFSEGAAPCPFLKSQNCALPSFKSQNCALPFFRSQKCTLPFLRNQK